MTRIQIRRDTTSGWAAANPILASGEPGLDTTTGDYKFGNGASTWTALTTRYPVSFAWQAVTFVGAWVNSGGTLQTAQYRKEGDVVRLRGSIKTGTLTTAAFNLPAPYRPPLALLYTAVMTTAGGLGAIYVNASGDVVPYYGGNTEVHLEGIAFSTIT